MKIVKADRGFRELTAKKRVGYNAALRYEDTSYLRTYGPSPKNHDHPAHNKKED